MTWAFNDDRPIYSQIIEQIERFIISGHWKPGERLPSVRDLAGEAGVNPNTMQRAMTELERRELIYSQRTSGKFITEDEIMIQQVKNDLAYRQIQDFLEGMKRIGYDISQTIQLISEFEKGESSNDQ